MAASSYQKDGRPAPAKLTVAADTATISGSSQARGGVAIKSSGIPAEHLAMVPEGRANRSCYGPVLVPEMNRRNVMMTFGIGALAAAIPAPTAHAHPTRPAPVPHAPAPGSQTGGFLFHDEFDGPAGSAPDPSKWVVSTNRTPIKNPVGFDRPEFWGQYRNSRENVFIDGNSNLVLRATKDGNNYFGGLVSGNWRGGIGTDPTFA